MIRDVSKDAILRRCPRLVAHLICESLGYFSPEGAANAIAAASAGRPFACDWYLHMADAGRRSLIEIGRDTLRDAIRHRHAHRTFMAEYGRAIALVRTAAATGDGPAFASWM